MTFQIVDDILDATSTSETLGKPVGNDETVGKNTYVKLYGIEGARAEAKKHTSAAMQVLTLLEGNHQFLANLIQTMETRIS